MTTFPAIMKRVTPILSFALLFAGLLFLSTSVTGCSDTGCGTKGDPNVPIGGTFELTGTDNTRISTDSFGDKYQLIYFGFTYCPDVCPIDLQKMTQALDLAGSAADKVQPIFVTIDPARDNPEAIAQYMQHFHPRFIGLTGTDAEIAAAASIYRVYYAKVENEEHPDAYLMNHSSNIYLMDCQGHFIRHFAAGTEPQEIADAIKALK